MTARATVAVIGAGFSGLLTAIHLLQNPAGPNVRLVERRGAFARGTAYSTLDPEHLLNVRASNMSAFPDDPTHFVRWLSPGENDRLQNQFVRRSQYGDYLQALIQDVVEKAAAGRLLLEPDAAVSVELEGEGWIVTLAMGRAFNAEAVVLALGNLPPPAPRGFLAEAICSPAYIADPWSLDAERLPATGAALLVGTGLSMIDVAIHIARLRPDLRLLALSRRGLLPRRHLDVGPAPAPRALPSGQGALAILKELRRDSRNQDWRAVLDSLRPHVHDIWKGWSAQKRQQFLRHARPWWDVHRHRLSPAVALKLDHLLASGSLRVAAGRIISATCGDDGLDILWRERAGADERKETVAAAINCAGPNGDPMSTDDPLLSALVQRGLIRADPHKLGLDVDLEGRVVGETGQVAGTLFAIGPLTRGALWETTSVPDIRSQALRCARLSSPAFRRRRYDCTWRKRHKLSPTPSAKRWLHGPHGAPWRRSRAFTRSD